MMTNYMIHWPQWNCKCIFSLLWMEDYGITQSKMDSHENVQDQCQFQFKMLSMVYNNNESVHLNEHFSIMLFNCKWLMGSGFWIPEVFRFSPTLTTIAHKMQLHKTTTFHLWDSLLINETRLRGLYLSPLSLFPQRKSMWHLSCH